MNYYNEIDPYCCKWLMNLIEADLIPMGNVDNRSIEDVQPEDLEGYDQCHFFAGIAGWSLALELAGVPPDAPLWTGSCPCQPLSSAGQRKGHADRRHLWPAFQHLIAQCRPPTIFGEQVASKDGREWFSAVRTDLERGGYACGCADLAAASVGAPHIRQRLFWVADSKSNGATVQCQQPKLEPGPNSDRRCDGVADSGSERRQQESRGPSRDEGPHGGQQDCGNVSTGGGEDDRLADAMRDGTERIPGIGTVEAAQNQRTFEGPGKGGAGASHELGSSCSDDGLGDAEGDRPQGANVSHEGRFVGKHAGWDDIELIPCADGKTRVTQPGLRPLADGVPARVGRLRAYGNAIVPQVAAKFIEASFEAIDD